MDEGVDAMPSRMMGLPSNHGTTLPATYPIPPNDCSTSSRGLVATGKWRLELLSNTAADDGKFEFEIICATDHTIYNATAPVNLEEQATINQRV
jgi:hypothetical protein